MVKKLLVIGSSRINYYELFEDCKVEDDDVVVEQCAWDDLTVCSYGGNGGLVVSISPPFKPIPLSPQCSQRSFQPDFVLFRGSTQGGARIDWLHLLKTIAHADVPTINSLPSFFISQDKAVLYGRLLRVQRMLGGFQAFPLVAQACYSDWRAATFPPDFPCVVKVGTASGGLGKAKIENAAQWEDFCSVAAMQPSVFTSENFVKWDFDIRIQKIGNHYRAFRRTSKHWKSNVDMNMKDEDIPVEDRYKVWIDEAAKECGMDICAMDLLRTEADGKEYILELNASSIGLNGRHRDEDLSHMKELTLRRMGESCLRKKTEAERRKAMRAGKQAEATETSEAGAGADTPVQMSYELLLQQNADLHAEVSALAARVQELERAGAPEDPPAGAAIGKKKSWLGF